MNTNVFKEADMGRTVTIRLNDEEQEFLESSSVLYKGSLSSIIKRLAIEKLEDEYDLMVVADYEKRERKGEAKYYTYEEMLKELNLEDENL